MSSDAAVEIYQAPEGEVIFDVDAAAETIWATEEQVADLFDVDRSVINRHVRNIYRDKELDPDVTSVKKVELRDEGGRQVRRPVRRFNLDMIISIGYRVNSKKATDFRIWATDVLKRYAVTGVAVNSEKLARLPSGEAEKRLAEIEGAMDLVKRLVANSELSLSETNGVLEVISRYMGSVQTISEYSSGHFVLSSGGAEKRAITAEQLAVFVKDLRQRLNERPSFGEVSEQNVGIEAADYDDLVIKLNAEFAIDDTVAMRAAKLLYYIVKDRPFLEGNKRIGALLFIVYLTQNDFSLTKNNETKISDRALTALVLLIAESEPSEKELILKLITKLLDD